MKITKRQLRRLIHEQLEQSGAQIRKVKEWRHHHDIAQEVPSSDSPDGNWYLFLGGNDKGISIAVTPSGYSFRPDNGQLADLELDNIMELLSLPDDEDYEDEDDGMAEYKAEMDYQDTPRHRRR